MDSRYQELSKASSVDEILAVTRDYISGFSGDDLAGLPPHCRPGILQDREDIEVWADRLLDAMRSKMFVIENEARLDRLTNYFLIASVRIRQLDS